MTIPLGCASLRTSTRPTRTTVRKPTFRHSRSYPNGRPYLVLLQVGFTLPPLLPAARCALTAPFHPYQQKLAVCFLWHFPWGRPRRTLSGTLLPWSPDFPPLPKQERSSGHLARGHNERASRRGQAGRRRLLSARRGEAYGHGRDPGRGFAIENAVDLALAIAALEGSDHIGEA